MSDPIPVHLTVLAGPPFIAIIMNWMMLGVLSVQVYLYSYAFPDDRKTLKGLVYGVYLLEFAQTILLTETAWKMFVSGFGNIEGFDAIGTIWVSICLIGGMVAFLVQCFNAYRVVIFSQNRIMPGLIGLMSLASIVGAFTSAIYVKKAGHISDLVRDRNISDGGIPVIILWQGIGSICDVVIAGCMCYYLRRNSQDITFSRTQALVSKLVQITVETGGVTASFSIITLALYYAPSLRNCTYFAVPMSLQAKVYSITMLAVLNCRRKLGMVADQDLSTWRDNDLAFALSHSRDTNTIMLNIASANLSQGPNICISKEEVVIADNQKVRKLSNYQPV